MNYMKYYGIYKKLPLINFISTVVIALVWGIVDAFEYITDIGELEVGAVFIWTLIGAVVGAIVMFFTAVVMSATIVRTDATIEIESKLKNS